MSYLGERHMSSNVHGLLHLPEVVTKLGLLWAHSCFPFEAANGGLLKMFHGSQGVEKQVRFTHVHNISCTSNNEPLELCKYTVYMYIHVCVCVCVCERDVCVCV